MNEPITPEPSPEPERPEPPNAEPTRVYPLPAQTVAELENRFTYHAPAEDQVPRYNTLRQAGKEMALLIVNFVPQGREQSLALTKVEEAIFWANAGIARNE